MSEQILVDFKRYKSAVVFQYFNGDILKNASENGRKELINELLEGFSRFHVKELLGEREGDSELDKIRALFKSFDQPCAVYRSTKLVWYGELWLDIYSFTKHPLAKKFADLHSDTLELFSDLSLRHLERYERWIEEQIQLDFTDILPDHLKKTSEMIALF